MTKKQNDHVCHASPRSGSRDAVESAIAKAKGDKTIRWQASGTSKRISRWKFMETSKRGSKEKAVA